MNTDNPKALKHIYNTTLLQTLASEIAEVYPPFDQKRFLTIRTELLKLEMKDRLRLIRDQLKKTLPQDYSLAVEIILKSTTSGRLKGFSIWPYTEFIQTYGLVHSEVSLRALKQLTTLFTSEWAVRPFINQNLKFTLDFLKQCALDSNHHVRRWVSEGTRPRLPWGERLQIFIEKPELTCKLIEPLIFDPELYVRKSVANHLNDISKDNPEYVIQVLQKWNLKAKSDQQKEKLNWIKKQALRSLIKLGHKESLKLVGFSNSVRIQMDRFKIKNKNIKMGDAVEFEFELVSLSSKPQKIIIDYVLHFVKSNGKTAPKVFKFKNLNLKPKERLSLKKSHSIKKITTRTYHSGEHRLQLQINGQIYNEAKWWLEV